MPLLWQEQAEEPGSERRLVELQELSDLLD